MSKTGPATWLSLLAAVSLVLAGILFCGYFGVFGPKLLSFRTAPTDELRTYSVELERGRIRIWFDSLTVLPKPLNADRWYIRWTLQPALPDLRRSLLGFDGHSMAPYRSTKGYSAYIVAFLIWCLLLLCLIAPVMWLRQRRLPMAVGFAVITDSKTQAGV